jgi:hypothetical protein
MRERTMRLLRILVAALVMAAATTSSVGASTPTLI